MRELRTCGKTVKVDIEIFNKCKYEKDSYVTSMYRYNNLVNWEIVTGDDATEIGLETDENSRDEYNEYLVLHFEDGTQATFCNSHVDMFRY